MEASRRSGSLPSGSSIVLDLGIPPPPPDISDESEEYPEGPYHHVNEGWIEVPHESSQPRSEASGSVVSTVLLDDRSSIKTNDEDDYPTDDETDAHIENALSSSIALASIFSTPKEHIADVRKAAREVGLHTALMRRPGARTDGKVSYDHWGQRENSWWVIMGRNAEAVKHLGNLQRQISSQSIVPGAFPPAPEQVITVTPPPSISRASGFLQLILAGAIGGAAVLFGMTRAF
ncbi:hypothetical protein HWV62_36963 [Athelia sp. TMB]|nr:hypothetical protein HWV62_36963 [Athelia sp. TMB]